MKQRSLQCQFKQYWQSKKHNDSEKKPAKSCSVCLQFLYCLFFISVDVTDTLNLLVALPRKTIIFLDMQWFCLKNQQFDGIRTMKLTLQIPIQRLNSVILSMVNLYLWPFSLLAKPFRPCFKVENCCNQSF